MGRSGPIIDEALLAVRLGIASGQSPDWPALLARLKSAAYTGVFAQGYERWWMALVLDWWSDQIDSDRALVRLGAPDRAGTIGQKTGLNRLTAIAEDPDSPGTKFWHRCIRSKRPVDPAFGFPLMPVWGQETWHDVDYLCLEEAKRDPRNARLSAAERTRIAKLLKGGL